MAFLGLGRRSDPEEVLTQLEKKEEELTEQLQDIDFGEGGGGRGRLWLGLLVSGALGAGLLYLLDPEKGQQRRQSLLSVASSLGGGGSDQPDRDQMVNDSVQTQLFSDASIPKGQININTVDGVVYVRGTASSQQQIDEIERRIKGIEGVDAVINLLRLPATA